MIKPNLQKIDWDTCTTSKAFGRVGTGRAIHVITVWRDNTGRIVKTSTPCGSGDTHTGNRKTRHIIDGTKTAADVTCKKCLAKLEWIMEKEAAKTAPAQAPAAPAQESKDINPIAVYYRALLKEINGAYMHGETYNGTTVTVEMVYAVADEWIAFMRHVAKAKNMKQFRAPTRAYLIRACT